MANNFSALQSSTTSGFVPTYYPNGVKSAQKIKLTRRKGAPKFSKVKMGK